MGGDGKKEKKAIHTNISMEAAEILDLYSSKVDKNGEKIFGSKARVLEKALELLDKQYTPEKDDLRSLWNRARDERDMVLVGKTTLLSYILGDKYAKAVKENIAVEMIEWYKAKHIENLTLEELLESIRAIWMAANYFYQVDINQDENGIYQMFLHHNFRVSEFSDYWGEYFKILLEEQKNVRVEIFSRKELLTLRIAPE